MKSYHADRRKAKPPAADHRQRQLAAFLVDALLDDVPRADLERKLAAAGFTAEEIEAALQRFDRGLVL